MSRRVGVDIGSTAIRVVEVRGIDAQGYAIVSRVGIARMRDGLVVSGRVRHPIAVADALRAALLKAGVPPYGFVAGFASPRVGLQRRQLPAVLEGDERIKALRTMGQKLVGSLQIEDENAVVAINEVRRFTTGDGTELAVVTVTSADRGDVDQLKKVFQLAQVQPRALDLVGAANVRALVRAPANGNEIHTVVDIGATKTSISTRQGLHLRSLHMTPIGSEAVLRAIMSSTNADREEATQRLQVLSLQGLRSSMEPETIGVSVYGSAAPPSNGSATPIQTAMDEAVNEVVDDLIEQVAIAVENDADLYNSSLTQGIVLIGRTSQIPGLRARLHDRIGVPVQLGRPWARLEKNRHTLPYLRDGKEDPTLMLELTTAVGLALWEERS